MNLQYYNHWQCEAGKQRTTAKTRQRKCPELPQEGTQCSAERDCGIHTLVTVMVGGLNYDQCGYEAHNSARTSQQNRRQ